MPNDLCDSCKEELTEGWNVLCGNHEETWCTACLDAGSFTCDECGWYVHDEDFHTDGEYVYCGVCYEEMKEKEAKQNEVL